MNCSQSCSSARRFYQTMTVSLLLLVCCALLSIAVGSVRLSVGELFSVLAGEQSPAADILWHVRLPRTAAALLAGMALAASGVIIQSVLQNPLAGPNIIGVNSGAGLFAALAGALFAHRPALLPAAAFAGALFALLCVYAIARATLASRFTLLLAGIAVSTMLSAGIDLIITLVPNAVYGAAAFRIGSLSGVTLRALRIPAVYILLGLAASLCLVREMDILHLGEVTAKSLGLNTALFRFVLLFIAAGLTGAAVSFCGLIGFVGLIVPHIGRFFVGSESKRLLPLSILMGGLLLTACDLAARTLFAPFELPVGILLSFLGGPFFILLLIVKKGGRTND